MELDDSNSKLIDVRIRVSTEESIHSAEELVAMALDYWNEKVRHDFELVD